MECIKIAGLCHDIGHGPFSHIFDDVILEKSTHPNRHHEVRSCLIIEILCKRELADELDDNHIAFIKSIINPQSHHTGALYQIVSNYLNGIDVDKFDYLARDAKTLGITTGFNPHRLINDFIIDQNGNIAYPKHCSATIYEMFHSRYMMHKKVYSHKTVKIIEQMLHDIFIKVDPIIGVSKSIENMDTFCDLTDDSIFYYIQSVIKPIFPHQITLDVNQYALVVEANDIYQRIKSRQLYCQILEIIDDDKSVYLQEFVEYLLATYSNFKRQDFVIFNKTIGFVSGNADPFNSIIFYNKKEDDVETFTLKKSHISTLMSNKIQETYWYLICKNHSVSEIAKSEIKNYQDMIKN